MFPVLLLLYRVDRFKPVIYCLITIEDEVVDLCCMLQRRFLIFRCLIELMIASLVKVDAAM
jgi:hypothetical protein